MNITPAWKKSVQASLKTNIEKIGTSATYASLATVTEDNKPAVRTVVMRGFAGEHYKEETGWQSNLLVIITDKTSRKINEIRRNPNTEINWYMNGTMEQFRIRGNIDIVDKEYAEDIVKRPAVSNLTNDIAPKLEVEVSDNIERNSLALQSFLKQQNVYNRANSDVEAKVRPFNWQAERLRHFIEFGASMRVNLVHSKQKDGDNEKVSPMHLEIKEVDQISGWFDRNNEYLNEAFENFVLLVVKVTSVLYWSPSTGTKVLL
ncbi:pyridoxamine 5'-phosphate oxidase-domain-containing protein [Mycotypha africana]|uniref:pyridoxamine 5'-phosphate oxidase-domain-containing protein n=1 Tax=Mycotypha africana TaxID=64632 RepID=UPI0023011867|nr:pyridoxamine 5'-phosphate oxidase-domain-containing protein [Mycotypha africana]KAI8984161.1 pyridoxamine 5'-phosphate oxidase-domain-containing protein [Mycotypha africana]